MSEPEWALPLDRAELIAECARLRSGWFREMQAHARKIRAMHGAVAALEYVKKWCDANRATA